jgi:hypothetical protein
MLDTPCSEVVWRVLATQSIRQFPLHFPSRASPYAIMFQLDSTQLMQWLQYQSTSQAILFDWNLPAVLITWGAMQISILKLGEEHSANQYEM